MGIYKVTWQGQDYEIMMDSQRSGCYVDGQRVSCQMHYARTAGTRGGMGTYFLYEKDGETLLVIRND